MKLTTAPLAFTLFNIPQTTPPPRNPTTVPSFTLTSTPYSDIWHIPPIAGDIDTFNGTIYATRLPLKEFQRARVTVSANWQSRYAQGGLVLFVPGEKHNQASSQPNEQDEKADPGSNSNPQASIPRWKKSPPRWIKTGIEFENNITFASLVASNPLSDWSISPWRRDKLTIELERGEEGALWAYVTDPTQGQAEGRTPIRQVTWGFEGEEDGREAWIGVFTAMPLPLEGAGAAGGGRLEVKFEGLEIEKRKGY